MNLLFSVTRCNKANKGRPGRRANKATKGSRGAFSANGKKATRAIRVRTQNNGQRTYHQTNKEVTVWDSQSMKSWT